MADADPTRFAYRTTAPPVAGARTAGAAWRRAIHPVLIVVALLWIVGFGAGAYRSASDHRRPVVPWLIYGAILGPLALLILHVAPPGRCWACAATATGWTRICLWCGNDLSGDPRRARTSAAGPAASTANTKPVANSPAQGAMVATTAALSPQRRASRSRRVSPAPKAVEPRAKVARRGAEEARLPIPTELRRTLATGIFVTGTVGLRSGSRYLIGLAGQRLQILGPAEDDPTAVVFERPVAEVDATGFNERLVLSQAGEAGGSKVLVFMALAGGSPVSVADEILGAAAASQRTAS